MIRDAILLLHDFEYKPEYLLADAAHASTNGFIDVFIEGSKRIVCWSHVIRAIDHQLDLIKNENQRKQIREDIYRIQLSQNALIFAKAVILFEKKWSPINDKIDEFIGYFKTEWCTDRNCGWYEGFAICKPSTNNGLEATNREIKDDHVRKRMPVSQFLNKVKY